MTSDTALPVEMDACPCERCQKPVAYDLIVPDEVWARISPKPVEGWKGGGVLCPECIVSAIIALSATRTAVKPLEWVDYTKGAGCPLRYLAILPFGRLMIFQWGAPDYWCFSWDSHGGKFAGNSVEAAKAAAQADYERRILSALSTTEGE